MTVCPAAGFWVFIQSAYSSDVLHSGASEQHLWLTVLDKRKQRKGVLEVVSSDMILKGNFHWSLSYVQRSTFPNLEHNHALGNQTTIRWDQRSAKMTEAPAGPSENTRAARGWPDRLLRAARALEATYCPDFTVWNSSLLSDQRDTERRVYLFSAMSGDSAKRPEPKSPLLTRVVVNAGFWLRPQLFSLRLLHIS